MPRDFGALWRRGLLNAGSGPMRGPRGMPPGARVSAERMHLAELKRLDEENVGAIFEVSAPVAMTEFTNDLRVGVILRHSDGRTWAEMTRSGLETVRDFLEVALKDVETQLGVPLEEVEDGPGEDAETTAQP